MEGPSYHHKVPHMPVNIPNMNAARIRSLLHGSGDTSIGGRFWNGVPLAILLIVVSALFDADGGVLLFLVYCLLFPATISYTNGGLALSWGFLSPSALVTLTLPLLYPPTCSSGGAALCFVPPYRVLLSNGALFASIGLLVLDPAGYALGRGLARLLNGSTQST